MLLTGDEKMTKTRFFQPVGSLLRSFELHRLKMMRVKVFLIKIICFLVILDFIEVSESTEFECGIEKVSNPLIHNGEVIKEREHPWCEI